MKKQAFSLIELLVVLAIIILLAGVSIPAFNSMQKKASLNRASEQIFDQIRIAKQESMTLNQPVTLIFIDPVMRDRDRKIFTELQRFRLKNVIKNSKENEYQPIAPRVRLPQGVIIHPGRQWTNLLTESQVSVGRFPGVRGEYRSLVFYPSGESSLESFDDSGQNQYYFLTLCYAEMDQKKDLKDFITISIDPKTSLPSIWKK